MRRKRRNFRPFCAAVIVLMAVVAFCMWRISRARKTLDRLPPASPPDASLVLVTGYCNCQRCCGWKRSWFGFGRPVYTYGKFKGRPKKIGVTARGTIARTGTIAADPKVYPFGTRLAVPGYGVGTVEDVGGSIKGRHIDIWFPTHEDAKRWGRRWLAVSPQR